MTSSSQLMVFGEALFDCFPDGETVLGGAPFNVAWHLQALGDAPQFISRVGHDDLGERIVEAMHAWGMSLSHMQRDSVHPTGQVLITIDDGEPHYQILEKVAYDFIEVVKDNEPATSGFFYHGSLAARNDCSRQTLACLTASPNINVFVDVNFREPFWQKKSVCEWLERARWAKLNSDELKLLGFHSADLRQDMTRMQTHFHLEQLIVTCGEKGALVRTNDGKFYQVVPEMDVEVVDTVGAGDAFTAMYIHGLLKKTPIELALTQAQKFASKVVALRGATTQDKTLYNGFK